MTLEQIVANIQWYIDTKTKQRQHMLGYLYLKLEMDDMHAVADAAMDIRELDASIISLRLSLEQVLNVETTRND